MTNKILSRPNIGVGVLVWRDQQLLLGERMSKNQNTCWQFPGGHLEKDESVIECAKREVLEETGLLVNNCRHIGFTDKSFEIDGQSYITLFVSCEYISGEAKVLEKEKCGSWKWFDWRHLPQPLFKPVELFLLQQPDLFSLHKTANIILCAQ